MERLLLVTGAVTTMVGTSAYFGLGQAWGGPVATVGVGVVAVGVGLLSIDMTGLTRWTGWAVTVSGFALVTAITASALGIESLGQSWEPILTGIFVLFMTTVTLFGIVGLISGSIPLVAAILLVVGASLLAAGAWQERLGDIGFLVATAGLVLLGANSKLPA